MLICTRKCFSLWALRVLSILTTILSIACFVKDKSDVRDKTDRLFACILMLQIFFCSSIPVLIHYYYSKFYLILISIILWIILIILRAIYIQEFHIEYLFIVFIDIIFAFDYLYFTWFDQSMANKSYLTRLNSFTEDEEKERFF